MKLATAALSGAMMFGLASQAAATEWNVSVWGKPRAFTEHIEKLADLVSEKTDGGFTLNISYGGLSKNRENLDGISIGAFEMAQFCAGYHRDKNPSITVLELPFLGISSLEQEVAVSMALYQHPAVVEDLARWNATLLMPSPMPQYNLVGLGDVPSSIADFKGMAVRATGGIGQALNSVGAVPTSMSATEVRQAMDSGVVSAVAFAPHAHMAYGTIENATWWTTNLNPGTVNSPVVVNTDALDALSESERDALLGSVAEALDHYVENYNSNAMAAWGPALKDRNISRVTFSEADLASFREIATPLAEYWIADNQARGIPARELYDMVTGLIAESK